MVNQAYYFILGFTLSIAIAAILLFYRNKPYSNVVNITSIQQ